MAQHAVTERKRAPSQRSIAARDRILDAAEQVFAERGFEGASIRDIAERAGVQKANVNFHGGPKEELFERIVARRATVLSEERMAKIQILDAQGDWATHDLLSTFLLPLISRAFSGDSQWGAYARIVAIVSTDTRWRDLAATHFDPVATRVVQMLCSKHPQADPVRVAGALVFSVSSMLALCTSQWRISVLGGANSLNAEDMIQNLLGFCEAGITDSLTPAD
ncbi:transcriptional regulator, TetR family [Aliiroseovarius halocynthiae]|uniref:TetR/AcrR family transcriptional regulator n=1 Tax=Aliiroseovarius halocynthiae TaxID=985055 RepID=A0A545SU22_9RHOB|nr:TetR/AcrR family transcriptional regulator [Aliiroseovarius halocynthiae]TQV68463.1 TetR/AcrR family transcriptional regulator [Aliiroseovarius halocynthiae]SMR70860.1 transcriptional regulator, TetR family [Aliiroseovarius halocynthiae]